MEPELDPEQALLRDTTARFIKDKMPLTAVRAMADGSTAAYPRYLRGAATLGWFAMFVDEQYGGGSVSGDPAGEAALVAEIRGAALQPGPFASVNAAAAIISRHGSDAQRSRLLPPLVSGECLCSVALSGDASWRPGGVSASADGEKLVIGGTVLADEIPPGSALVLVAQQGRRRTTVVVPSDAPGVTVTALSGLDITRSLCSVALTDVVVDKDAVIDMSEPDIDRGCALAVGLIVAETVGAMEALFEMTRQYALDRVAFGRPIGSFQALKHILADLSLTVEFAKALSAAATRSWRDDASYAAESASIAKAYLGDRSLGFVQGCQQVHGGIGFAWEHDLHLFMRRIAANGALCGTAVQHRAFILAAHKTEFQHAEVAA